MWGRRRPPCLRRMHTTAPRPPPRACPPARSVRPPSTDRPLAAHWPPTDRLLTAYWHPTGRLSPATQQPAKLYYTKCNHLPLPSDGNWQSIYPTTTSNFPLLKTIFLLPTTCYTIFNFFLLLLLQLPLPETFSYLRPVYKLPTFLLPHSSYQYIQLFAIFKPTNQKPSSLCRRLKIYSYQHLCNCHLRRALKLFLPISLLSYIYLLHS